MFRNTRERQAARRATLSVERLEGRDVPASYSFSGAASTDWNNVNNWYVYGTTTVPSSVPGSGDTIYVGNVQRFNDTYHLTLEADYTVSALHVSDDYVYVPDLRIPSGKTLTVTNGGTFGGNKPIHVGGALDLTGGTMAWNWGDFQDHGGNFGTLSVSNGATLSVADASSRSMKIPVKVGRTAAGSTNSTGTVRFTSTFSGTLNQYANSGWTLYGGDALMDIESTSGAMSQASGNPYVSNWGGVVSVDASGFTSLPLNLETLDVAGQSILDMNGNDLTFSGVFTGENGTCSLQVGDVADGSRARVEMTNGASLTTSSHVWFNWGELLIPSGTNDWRCDLVVGGTLHLYDAELCLGILSPLGAYDVGVLGIDASTIYFAETVDSVAGYVGIFTCINSSGVAGRISTDDAIDLTGGGTAITVLDEDYTGSSNVAVISTSSSVSNFPGGAWSAYNHGSGGDFAVILSGSVIYLDPP